VLIRIRALVALVDLQNLLLTGGERAISRARAESAEEKAARLAERLREMGVDPDPI